MEEREISLVDLMVDILLHWRGIIVLMLIGGVLMGGFSYVRSARSVQAQKAEMENIETDRATILEQMRDGLTQAQLNNVDSAIYCEELYREKQAYLKQSILLGLDPDSAKKATLIFLVKADTVENVYNFGKIYEDLVESSELLDEMSVVSGESASLTREIYSLSRSGGEEAGRRYGTDASLNPPQESYSFTVSVLHYDEKMCLELAQVIIDFVDKKHDALVGRLGAHEVVVLDQLLGAVGDRKVLQSREAMGNEVSAARNEAERIKGAFSDEERAYYELLVDDAQEAEETEEEAGTPAAAEREAVPAPRVSLKYVLLGMVLAAFLYAFLLFMVYVMNNKIRATDQMQELYGIPQLGQIPEDGRKKKVFGFVDEWFLALRYWNQRKFTPDEALKLAAVAIKMAAGKEELGMVCLMGCDLKGRALEGCERMKSLLGGENVEARILNNVLYDAEAMGKLEDVKGVVLVEKAGSTLYTEIAQELALLKRQGIKVLGGIIVG